METVRLRLEGWEQIKVRARPMSTTTPTLTTTAIPFIATAFRQTEESSLELTGPIDSGLTMSLFMLQEDGRLYYLHTDGRKLPKWEFEELQSNSEKIVADARRRPLSPEVRRAIYSTDVA